MKPIKLLKNLAVTAAALGVLFPFPTLINAAEITAASRQVETVRDLARSGQAEC